jgi:mono/diheme cytochrome c family protein
VKRFLTSVLALSALAASLAGCREDPSSDPPVLLERNMFDQERYNPQSWSDFFDDHRTMRTPIEGTLSREDWDRYAGNEELLTGMANDGNGFVLQIPAAAIEQHGDLKSMVERGQERFNIYCAPCHSRTGDGKGMVARAKDSFPSVTNLHEAKIKNMPDGQLFATMTNGVRTMPSYAAQIPLRDRWAIVAYVRALEMAQVSQAEPKK